MEKFLCCLPLWTCLIFIGIITIAEGVVQLYVLKSSALVFTSLVTEVFVALTLTNIAYINYRKGLFTALMVVTFLQLPLVGLAFFSNDDLAEQLFSQECIQAEGPDAEEDGTTHDICTESTILNKSYAFKATAILLCIFLLRAYFLCTLFSFSRGSSERIAHDSDTKTVMGELAQV